MTNPRYLFYSKTADSLPIPVRILPKERADNVPPDIQNHFVICDPVTGKIYTYTEFSNKPASTGGYNDAKEVGKVDFSRVIFFEFKSGPVGRKKIHEQMSRMRLSKEDRKRVRASYNQLRYLYVSKRAYKQSFVKDNLNYYSFYDTTTDKILTCTKILKTKPALDSCDSNSRIVGTVYLNRTAVCLTSKSDVASREQLQRQMDSMDLLEEEKGRVLRAQDQLRYLVLSQKAHDDSAEEGIQKIFFLYDKTTGEVCSYTKSNKTKPKLAPNDSDAKIVGRVYLGYSSVCLTDKFGLLEEEDVNEAVKWNGWSKKEKDGAKAAWKLCHAQIMQSRPPEPAPSGRTPAVLKFGSFPSN